VLVERSSRLVLLCKMADASAHSAPKAFTAKLNLFAYINNNSLVFSDTKGMAMDWTGSIVSGVLFWVAAESLGYFRLR